MDTIAIEYHTAFSAEQIMSYLRGRYDQMLRGWYELTCVKECEGYVKLSLSLEFNMDEQAVWLIAKDGLFAIG